MPFLISFAEIAIKLDRISVMSINVSKHKRDSVVSRAAFCLVNGNLELECSLKGIGLLTLGDRDNVVAGRRRIYLVTVVAISGHILIVGRAFWSVDADCDVIFANVLSRQRLAFFDFDDESPLRFIAAERTGYDLARRTGTEGNTTLFAKGDG